MSTPPGDLDPTENDTSPGPSSPKNPVPTQTTFRESLGHLVDSWQACVLLPVVAVIFGLMAALAGMILATMIYRVMGGELTSDPLELIASMAKHPLLLILLMLPNQLVFLFLSSGFGALSRFRLSERLALLRGHDGLWTWPIYILATPVIGFVVSNVLGEFVEESPNMKMIADIIRSQTGFGIFLVIFLIAVVPGVCEEFMFRGFTQNFLARHWGIPLSILVSSILFAVAHIDPVHILAVFPIGVWLGVISWRTGSIIPSIMCHFFNNCLSVLAVYFDVEKPENQVALYSVAGISAAFFLVSIVLFATRHQNQKEAIL